jgi:hypothetical protein
VTDLYAITAEEQAKYTAFSTTMWRQPVGPLPQTLWYYTNAPTFGRILKTGEVWSTQISWRLPDGASTTVSGMLFPLPPASP